MLVRSRLVGKKEGVVGMATTYSKGKEEVIVDRQGEKGGQADAMHASPPHRFHNHSLHFSPLPLEFSSSLIVT